MTRLKRADEKPQVNQPVMYEAQSMVLCRHHWLIECRAGDIVGRCAYCNRAGRFSLCLELVSEA